MAIVLIMQHVLKTLEAEHLELAKAFFRQDNAGCYHSANTILACRRIEKTTKIKISRIDFSDPQGGKGSADRLAATCKCHIRMYVNEGNNVTNATEMKEALLSHGGVEGVRVAVINSIDESSMPDEEKIPGISKLNNFEFKNGDIRAWRAYNVGKGKKVKTTTIQDVSIKWLSAQFSPGDFKLVKKTSTNVKARSDKASNPKQMIGDEQLESIGSSVYSCPQEGCARVFQRSSALEKHLSLESCSMNLEKKTMLDVAKDRYALLLKEDIGPMPSITSTEVDGASHVAKEGWALKSSSKKYRFNEKQRSYLTAKFNIGQSSGRKLRAEDVSKDMRHARGEDGNRLFTVSEFLSVEQVSSFFSRLATKIKQKTVATTESDALAAEEEGNFNAIRQTVLSSLELQHPIVLDQFNICEMVYKGTLTKLKKDMLQRMCNDLNIDVPRKSLKKTLIVLLEDLISTCSCKGNASK